MSSLAMVETEEKKPGEAQSQKIQEIENDVADKISETEEEYEEDESDIEEEFLDVDNASQVLIPQDKLIVVEGSEEKSYRYINSIPLVGALYGICRLVVHGSKGNDREVKCSGWGICKNLLISMTLAAGAMMVPKTSEGMLFAVIATGLVEGIINTVVNYLQSTEEERREHGVEEMIYTTVNHTPIVGMLYNIPRAYIFAQQGNKEELKKSLWSLCVNTATTAVTITSVIVFGPKSTEGSIPAGTKASITASGICHATQSKVTLTLAKRGASRVTAPVVKAGRRLVTKEAKKLKRKIEKEVNKKLKSLADSEGELLNISDYRDSACRELKKRILQQMKP